MFEFQIPTKIIEGQGYVNKIGETVKEYGKRIFLVSDALTMQETGYLSKVKTLIEEETHGVLVFNKVYSDSNSDLVNKGADQARNANCDCIVGFGGKTTLNIAKAITYLVSNGGILEDYFLGKKGNKKTIKYIEIPSAHGYCPGLLNYFYVTDKYEGMKKSITSTNNFADVIILDPKLTSTIPAKFTSSIAMENIALSIDTYISKSSNAVSDTFALKAIEFTSHNITKSVQDAENMTLRSSLSTAGLFTSLALANSAPGVTYALSLGLNAVYGIYQGITSSILLPYVMEYSLTSSANKYVQIAKAFGEDTSNITVVEAAIKAIEGVRKLLYDLKIPQKLSDLELDKDELYNAAKIARSYEFLHFLPRPVSQEDLYNILLSAY